MPIYNYHSSILKKGDINTFQPLCRALCAMFEPPIAPFGFFISTFYILIHHSPIIGIQKKYIYPGGGGYSVCQGICIGSAGKIPIFQPPNDKRTPFGSMVRRTTSFLAWYDKWPQYFHIWCRIMHLLWSLIHVRCSCSVLTLIFSLNVAFWPLYFLLM